MLGAFLAQDLLLFVLFFDLMLVPFFFLIGELGQPATACAATIKMIDLHAGRLAADAGRGDRDGGARRRTAAQITLRARRPAAATRSARARQDWIFCFFAAAFLVKMPAFPLHGWMPDAYRAAPLPVLALLSGVLSKVGAYGFLRIVLPLFPDGADAVPGADPA